MVIRSSLGSHGHDRRIAQPRLERPYARVGRRPSSDPGDALTERERKCRGMTRRPNILLILTDQQHHPPPYESEELAEYRREHLAGVERLRQNGVSFRHHYPMSAACAPSRASLLTGQYPSLHGVTQTDGIAKTRRQRRHVLAGAGHRADAGRLVPGRRLSDVLQGQVARLAPASRRRRRRRVPAVDRRRRDADRRQHPEVPGCRSARRVRLLGVGGARPARTRQAQHRPAQGPVHRRRDDRAAQAPRRRRGRRAVADGLLVPEPARRLAVRPDRAHAGAALPPLTGAACRAGTDAQRGPLDQALLPAELRRQLEHDHRAAAVERDST